MLEKGTKVKIKDKETLMFEYKINMCDRIDIEDTFVSDMWRYCGKKATIVDVRENCRLEKYYITYRLKFDGNSGTNCYSWNEYMFEEINKEEYAPINIEDIL